MDTATTQPPLSSTNVAGDTIRDLIEALRLLDQDAKHNVDRASVDLTDQRRVLRIHLFSR